MRNLSLAAQLLIVIAAIAVTGIPLFLFREEVGYQTVALILLSEVFLVSAIASFTVVLTAAFLSALTWNFFFIPPIFTFHIRLSQDLLMFFMYFAAAIVNAVFTARIRNTEKRLLEEREKARTVDLYNSVLHSLSHELRSPISAIIAANEAFPYANGHREISDLSGTIAGEADRLNRHVQNLLNMSRLESGLLRPVPDWIEPADLLQSVKLSLPGGAGRVEISCGNSLPLFRSDTGLLYQLLHNLVHNALKYSEGKVILSAYETDDNGLEFSVRDFGPGIPVAQRDAIWELFNRAGVKASGGLGLGLAIAKGFAAALDGDVVLENSTRGCLFIVRLKPEKLYLNQLSHE